MTQSEEVPPANGLDPGPLPPFAAFALRRTSDPHDNEHEAAETASLGTGAVAARRRAFRLGRAAAHAALRDLGRDDGPILSGYARQPVWPEGLVGAISHTGELAVALVARRERTDGVGIDIEARREAPELGGQVPRAEERAWLHRAAPAEQADLLLALFSAKESIFKAFHPRVGVLFGFEAASLEPAGHGFRARLIHDLDPDYPADRDFAIGCRWHEDHVMTWLVLPGGSGGE